MSSLLPKNDSLTKFQDYIDKLVQSLYGLDFEPVPYFICEPLFSPLSPNYQELVQCCSNTLQTQTAMLVVVPLVTGMYVNNFWGVG